MLIFISMARSTNFCFRTTYIGMFLCFRSILRCFQCFVRGPSSFGKKFPMNPPYPLEITTFEPPSPSEFGGGGMDIFWNHTISRTVRRVKFETILKHHKWYLCQISHTNHAIICLCYYPRKVFNFHMYR